MNKPKKSILWMSFSSVRAWNDPTVWNDYLRSIEALFEDRLNKLDENDPVRRKADVKKDEGQYITDFEEGTRTLFGVFAKTKIEFTINYSRAERDQWGRSVCNRITFYIPISDNLRGGTELDRIVNLFRLTIEKLEAFTGESDLTEIIYSKKSHDGCALDITTELIGVFWLTYFGPTYCDFFKRDTLLNCPGAVDGPANGITIRLAEAPGQVGANDRRNAEIALGEKYFAGFEQITDFNKRKLPGELPNLEQLRSEAGVF